MTAADRPSVTDNARAEADPYLVDRHLAHVEAAVGDYRTVYPEPHALSANLALAVEGARLLAAGRAETTTDNLGDAYMLGYSAAAKNAETTTATTEDAALDAATEAVEAEFACINAGSDHGARDVAEAAVYAFLDELSLLASVRTRPAETTTEWGVRFYGRGPFDMPCEGRDDAEAEVDQVDDKHAPAVLIRREVTAWTEAE